MAFQQNGGIVIYRSRAEMEIDKMLWEGDGSGVEIFVCVMLMAFATVIFYSQIQKRIGFRSKFQKYAWPVSIAAGVPTGYGLGVLIKYLLITI